MISHAICREIYSVQNDSLNAESRPHARADCRLGGGNLRSSWRETDGRRNTKNNSDGWVFDEKLGKKI